MNIKIGISTCKKYANKTTPILISTLLKSGIKNEDIYVFCGDSESQKNFIKDGINCYTATHNSFDYTSYIEILENNLNYNWFLMQDTCYVGENFKKFLYEKTPPTVEKIAIKSWPPASMSMGYFKYDFLNKYRRIILALRNLTKEEAVQYEDLIMRRMEYDAQGTKKCLDYGHERIEYAPNDFYGTKTKRIVEYFPHLDLYKLKSNWGQSGQYTKNL